MLGALSGFIPNAQAISPQEVGLEEGDLISSFAYDKDPDIFIVNQNGYKRLFLNPEIFGFYGHLRYGQVKSVTPIVRDQFATANYYKNCESGDGAVYGLNVVNEDDATFHRMDADASILATQEPGFLKQIFCINKQEFSWYKKGSNYISATQVPKYFRVSSRSLMVLRPENNEDNFLTSNFSIKWVATGIGNIVIQVCSTNGIIVNTCKDISSSLSAAQGSYTWVVQPLTPIVPGTNLKIRIINAQDPLFYNTSEGLFDIPS